MLSVLGMLDIEIGIDGGHGGRDPGAIGLNGLKEKDVTLNISMKLSELLQKRSLKTVLTRNSDVHLGNTINQDLSARTKILNQSRCNYAVSIHCNSSINRSANYFSVYVFGLGGEAEKLALSVVKDMQIATGWNWGADDDGVREGNLHMIRETNMPSILIECGFISNSIQEAQLKQPEFQQLLANAIYKGILNYLGIKEENKVIYKTLNDVPSWAKPTIKKLMDRKTIAGDGSGNINLSEDMVRVLVILDREGLFK